MTDTTTSVDDGCHHHHPPLPPPPQCRQCQPTTPMMTTTWPPAHGTISPPSWSSISTPTQVCLFHFFFLHNCSTAMTMKTIGPLLSSPTGSMPTCPASPQHHPTMANSYHHQDNASTQVPSPSITQQRQQRHPPMSPEPQHRPPCRLTMTMTSPMSPSPCGCDDSHNVVIPHIPQPHVNDDVSPHLPQPYCPALKFFLSSLK